MGPVCTMICYTLGEDLVPGRAMSSHTHFLLANKQLDLGERIGNFREPPGDGLQEVEEKICGLNLPSQTQPRRQL